MDFQTDTQLHVIGEDDISMDVEVTNPASGLTLTSDMGTAGVGTQEAMSYLLPHTSTSTEMHHIESIAEQQGISITTEEPDDSSVLKVDLPIPSDPSELVQQSSVFISLTSDNVIVKTEEDASRVIHHTPVTAVQTAPQLGQINLLNYSNNSGRKSLLTKPTNSTVQLTHDGKVNIVTREKIEVPQVQYQQVVLADGSLAYINLNANMQDAEVPQEDIEREDVTSQTKGDNLQAVRLDDGSIAYLTASIIPEGSAIDTSNLSLENDKSQIETTSSDHNSSWTDSMDPNQQMLQMSSSIPTILNQPSTAIQKVPSKSVGNSVSTPTLFGDKAYKCPYTGCHKVYTTLHHLKVHERTHTGDKPYACEFTGCDKAFATAYGLKSHSRVHTGEKPYKCPMEDCTKAFKTSGDLQKHVRTHTGEKPFKCPFEGCDKRFTTSNIRKVHIRVHTGERPYVCPIDGCGKSFSSATNYKNHVRIHTGERPYVCSVQGCGKRFTEYSSLYKHHIVHTHSKPYVCSHCGKTYRQTSTLAMHKRTAHGDESGTLDLELVIPKQSVTPISTNVEDNEGALVINTADNTSENVFISSAASSQQSLINSAITLKTSPSSVSTSRSGSSSSINPPAVATPIAAVTATTVPKEGLLLPPELQGQRVFVITEPAQLQILQHITQNPQQIKIIKNAPDNEETSTTDTDKSITVHTQ